MKNVLIFLRLMKLVSMILYLVAKLRYQAMPWREMIETETEGVSPFISGILSIKNVYLMSSAKASSGLALR